MSFLQREDELLLLSRVAKNSLQMGMLLPTPCRFYLRTIERTQLQLLYQV